MTPAAQLGSVGGTSMAPTITSLPRGSLTTAERNSSKRCWKTERRSVRLPAPRPGPPETTTRVGSPPVCVSMTWMWRSAMRSPPEEEINHEIHEIHERKKGKRDRSDADPTVGSVLFFRVFR